MALRGVFVVIQTVISNSDLPKVVPTRLAWSETVSYSLEGLVSFRKQWVDR